MPLVRSPVLPIPVLLLLGANFFPAAAGFWKLPGVLEAAAAFAPPERAVLLIGFLAGWGPRFVVMAALLLHRRSGFFLCAWLFLLLALFSLLLRAHGGDFYPYILQFGLLALPSSRAHFGVGQDPEP